MEELFENIIKWIFDNIGLLILGIIIISITISISSHFSKNINITTNNKNIQNNYNNTDMYDSNYYINLVVDFVVGDPIEELPAVEDIMHPGNISNLLKRCLPNFKMVPVSMER